MKKKKKKMMMNSGGKDAAGRLMMIPSSIKNTIENIKEITGQSHSEEEIYAMLKECSMDPNETAQKLLLQGARMWFLSTRTLFFA